MSEVSRKDFIASIGTIGAAVGLPEVGEAQTHATQAHPVTHPPAHPATHKSTTSPIALQSNIEGYSFFNGTESNFVEAAVERLIPTDSLGLGAREAGVAYFIDQQLIGDFGYAAKMYMQGPWPDALPTQGYQLPMTPREVYHIGVIATNQYCQQKYGKTFATLNAAHQDEVLKALESGEAGFTDFSSKVFFQMLLANTLEGYFADPMYGGNRNKAGWRLVGFPGAAAAYIGLIAKHNVPYRVTPMGIADLQRAETSMSGEHDEDAMHEMRVHMMLGRKALGLE